MYYLNCVCTVVDYNDNDISRYRNYSNWMNMSDFEDRLIFILALTLSPDELEDRVFFESPALCPDCINTFYEINQISNRLVLTDSILIGGRSCEVKKIMAYKSIWMQKYYFEPMMRLQFRFNQNYQTESSSACVIS